MKIVPRSNYLFASGETGLFDLVRTHWRRRVLIWAVGGVCAAIGGAIAYALPSEYGVSTTLRPVALNQLDALNRSKIYSMPTAGALKRVGRGWVPTTLV